MREESATRMNAPTPFPEIHVKGLDGERERRASIGLRALETFWFNSGALRNITCANCYIESSPRNDAFAFFGAISTMPSH